MLYGGSNKARLQRIYGTAYNKKEELAEHLERMEDAKRRDHNRLGREMELFTTFSSINRIASARGIVYRIIS